MEKIYAMIQNDDPAALPETDSATGEVIGD